MRDFRDVITLELRSFALQNDLEPDQKARWGVLVWCLLLWPVACIAVICASFRGLGQTPTQQNRVIALYPEYSNRTRHVIRPDLDCALFIWVGRPRSTDALKKRIINVLKSDVQFLFPINPACALRAIPTWMAHLPKLAHSLVFAGGDLPLREVLGILYRCHLGFAQARWWQQSGPRPDMVLFGHTGNVDCTLLEYAMQENGARTVHVVHGIGAGWAFAAHSDLGLYTNGFDAGSVPDGLYQQATTCPFAPPKIIHPANRCTLFTSHTHPMNPHYQSRSVAPDTECLDWVRQVWTGQQINWRPHPALDLVSASDQATLVSHARRLGFTRLETLPDLTDAGLVLTTASTLALDALRAGTLPVLLAPVPVPQGSVYTMFDIAHTWQELAELAEAYQEPQHYAARFEQVWHAVDPGTAPTWQDISTVLANGGAR